MGRNVSKTLVIPTYTVNQELVEMTLKCIASHRNQVDEVIVSEDAGIYSPELQKVADIYIYGNQNIGFTKNVNRGWILSHSEFTIIANSDTYLVSGNLNDICKEDEVVCPEIENLTNYPDFEGSYWVTPKLVRDKYGMLDERLKTYHSDIDYYMRIKHLFRKDHNVIIHHHKGQTILASQLDVAHEMLEANHEFTKILEEKEKNDFHCHTNYP
jgi:hypothetical protein